MFSHTTHVTRGRPLQMALLSTRVPEGERCDDDIDDGGVSIQHDDQPGSLLPMDTIDF